MHDIYQMWYLADQDLLSSYHVLRDTGQGLNRVQKCPSIGRAMTNVISRAQGRLGGGWVGSSVVHLGDHNGTFPRPPFFLVVLTLFLPLSIILRSCVIGYSNLGFLVLVPPCPSSRFFCFLCLTFSVSFHSC